MSEQAVTIAWIEKLRSDPPQHFGRMVSPSGASRCAMGWLYQVGHVPRWLSNGAYIGEEGDRIVYLNDTVRMPLPQIAKHIRERAIYYGVLKVGEVADPVTRKEAVHV
jgi:hypothetical protein